MEPSWRLLLSDYSGAMESQSPPPSSAKPFCPVVAVVVGILTSVFSITFRLLLKRSAVESLRPFGSAGSGGGFGSSSASIASGDRRNPGVVRAAVEFLPVFRFSALRGQKDAPVFAVCLGRFEPIEALGLLPKCRLGIYGAEGHGTRRADAISQGAAGAR